MKKLRGLVIQAIAQELELDLYEGVKLNRCTIRAVHYGEVSAIRHMNRIRKQVVITKKIKEEYDD